jgi:photosystem II stability/assembly factor-like uncharacterized protein
MNSLKKKRVAYLAVVACVLSGAAFLFGLQSRGSGDVTPRASAAATGESVVDARIVDGEEGWALTPAGLSWTDDAGGSWSPISPPGLATANIANVYFANTEEGQILATGPSGEQDQVALEMYSTSDGGLSWSKSSLPEGRNASVGWTSSSFADASDGYVAVQLGAPAGAGLQPVSLMATHDGGATWETLPTPPVAGYISFGDPSDGWLDGGANGSELFRTTDGGRSWSQIQVPAPEGVGSIVSYGLPRIGEDGDGLLPVTYNGAGEGGNESTTVGVFQTSDGGEDWSLLSTVPLKGIVGPGSAPPDTSFVSDQALIVQDPASTSATLVSQPASASKPNGPSYIPSAAGATTRPLSAASAPDGISTFAAAPGGADAFAVVNRNVCASKSQCTTTNELLLTSDGSRSWTPVTPP